jgi:hypothetical protein
MATKTKIYVYGFRGWEEEIDSHIKTKVMFAIADEKKTQLAWYLFVQDMPARWELAFDLASFGDRDRNEIFGSAGTTLPFLQDFPFKFHIGAMAPRLLKDPGTSWASLDLHDDVVAGTTNCLIYVDKLLHVDKPRSILLWFQLRTENKRRTLDITKTGFVYLLGVERFVLHALEVGPTKGVALVDPYAVL